MENWEDGQLIRCYLNGNDASLDVLIARYLKPVYNLTYNYVCSKEEAEDVVQEVFVRVWKKLKHFDQNKNFRAWLFAIAKHASIDFLRKKNALVFSSFGTEDGENPLVESITDAQPLADEIADRKGIAGMMDRATAFLSPGFRMVLSLRYNEDLTFARISERLGEPLDTVKSRHRRALVKLKHILGKIDEVVVRKNRITER